MTFLANSNHSDNIPYDVFDETFIPPETDKLCSFALCFDENWDIVLTKNRKRWWENPWWKLWTWEDYIEALKREILEETWYEVVFYDHIGYSTAFVKEDIFLTKIFFCRVKKLSNRPFWDDVLESKAFEKSDYLTFNKSNPAYFYTLKNKYEDYFNSLNGEK